ncbi:MAG TPA: molybdopterin oxidoreductase family protein [Methylomirabilota bacterium]|jgi:anaerobic selenocysteine-containing dehydrogenase|nr:molybdopterin oxidoreductase family protein [Methylomirabilota bacterium]
MAELETHLSVCPHDCPSACSLSVTVQDGRLVDVVGDPAHPFTQGVICGKVHDYAERVYSPLRVLYPMRRVGPKGTGEFERISWGEAIEEIAHRFTRVLAQWGPEAVLPFSYAGTLGRIQYYAGHPLFHALGASQLDRTICVSTAYAGWKATVGIVAGNDAEQMVGADLVILWGINAAYTHINVMTLVKHAKARGAYVVCIDPYRTRTAKQADEHLMIRSGTDGALALGLMHVLVGEDRVDHAYIARATTGFAALREHVRAYPPARVAEITGLPVEAILRLARRYGSTPATFIRAGIGLSRHENGGMTCRALACLPALTGAYAHPAGGALLGSSGAFGPGDTVLERRDLLPDPPPRTINMIHLGRALTDPELAPPVKALYVYNSNPAAVCPQAERVLQGLAREDLFTVVHEQMQTDTADYADILLPATTSLEHTDLYRSFGHLYLQLAEPVLAPLGEAKSNWEVCGLLGRALGVRDRGHYAKPAPELIDEFLAASGAPAAGITYERLRTEHSVRISVPRPYLPFADGAPTPSGKVEFYSESLARAGLPALPVYVPLAESAEDAAIGARWPLRCHVPPNRFFLNSSFSQSALLRKRQGGAVVTVHPDDAARRGIVPGDLVAVRNDRGRALFTAVLSEDTPPGQVVIEGVWWHKFMPGGRGVNVLTSDKVADLGGGPAFHSTMVEIGRADPAEARFDRAAVSAGSI